MGVLCCCVKWWLDWYWDEGEIGLYDWFLCFYCIVNCILDVVVVVVVVIWKKE